jgi:hypothetical protein
MSRLLWLTPFFALVCSLGLCAQGAPQVFVSTGTAGKIYSINTSTGIATLLISTQGADYEGMVVAPDNAPGTTHPYLVYACDSNNNSVVRFDPAAATPIAPEVVYSNGALQHPQCGRITFTGDLVVTSKDAGAGWWMFPGITAVELGSVGFPAPTQLDAAGGGNQGVAQKNTGDLLIVDNANNQVLRSPSAAFSSNSNFITSGLSKPVGIARRGDGDVFVSNQGSQNVMHFNAQGQSGAVCQSFTNKDLPFFMQMSLDNTLYIAVSGGTGGSVRAVNAGTCQMLNSFGVPFPAVGVALAPTTATMGVTASNGSALVNFGFAAFELNNISGPCGGSISVSLLSPEGIGKLIALTGTPAGALTPAVNLGLDGFEAVFSTLNMTGCTAADGTTNNFQVADLVSTSVTDPAIVVCDDPNTNCQPQATNLAQIGVWPIGGYLPQDITTGGRKSLKCNVFLVNSHPTNLPGQEAGTFCGFESPVNNTFNFLTNSQDASAASSFKPGKSVPVKFKLSASSNCKQPFIKDAIAMLSVALIADASGNSTFMPIGLISNGSSGLAQPLFKADNNQQYLFNWDTSSCIMPSGAIQTCPSGLYSLTVSFLTDNTAGNQNNQSIYTSQTTEVTLK